MIRTTPAPAALIAPNSPPAEGVADIKRRFVMKVVLPLWLAAGVADWICHRATLPRRLYGRRR
jgi:hypothetical protein